MKKDLEKGIDWVFKEAKLIKESFGLSGQIDYEYDHKPSVHLTLRYIEDDQQFRPLAIRDIGDLYYCANDRNPGTQERLRNQIGPWLENEVIPDIRKHRT